MRAAVVLGRLPIIRMSLLARAMNSSVGLVPAYASTASKSSSGIIRGIWSGPIPILLSAPPVSASKRSIAACAGSGGDESTGVRFVFEPPSRRLTFKGKLKARKPAGKPSDVKPEVELDISFGGDSVAGLNMWVHGVHVNVWHAIESGTHVKTWHARAC
jgi:hypothetical protein